MNPRTRRRRTRYKRKEEAQRRAWADYKAQMAELIGQERFDEAAQLKPPRTCYCGQRLKGSALVEVRMTEAGAHVSKVARCSNVWGCPDCSRIIRAGRADEISEGIRVNHERGGGVYLLTLTIRHKHGDSLKHLLEEVLLPALTAMKGTRAYKRAKVMYGIFGDIRTLEITWSEINSWHPHFHIALFTDSPATDALAHEMKELLSPLWVRAVERRGGLLPDDEHGIDVRPLRSGGDALARYLTKIGGEALELTASDLKDSKGQGMSPFQFLDSDDPKSRKLWREYMEATRGKSAIRWSRGLRSALGMDGERTDAEIVAELEQRGELAAALDAETSEEVRKRGLTAQVLELIERGRHDRVASLVGCRFEYAELFDMVTGRHTVVPVFKDGSSRSSGRPRYERGAGRRHRHGIIGE